MKTTRANTQLFKPSCFGTCIKTSKGFKDECVPGLYSKNQEPTVKLKDLRRKMKGKSKKNGEIINKMKKMEERKRKMAKDKNGKCHACERESHDL